MTQEWNAELYDSHHRYVADLAKDMVAELAPAPGERVLDLGCGTGRMTEWLLEAGAEVVAVDSDPLMVAAARQRCPSADVRQADARELGDLAVDSVISNATLHWIPEAERVVSELSRILQPRGSTVHQPRLVVEFGGYQNLEVLRRAVSNALGRRGRQVDWAARWYFPRISEYTALLEHGGFVVTDARWWPRPTPLEGGRAGLRNWISMFLSDLQVPDQEAFFTEVELECEPELWRGDHYSLDYARIRVRALLEPTPNR